MRGGCMGAVRCLRTVTSLTPTRVSLSLSLSLYDFEAFSTCMPFLESHNIISMLPEAAINSVVV